MKTICFFSGDITRAGGTERVSVTIGNQLKREGKYRIVFLSLTEQNSRVFYPLEKDIQRYHLGERWITPGPGYLPVLPKLRSFLQRERVDVLIDIDIALDVLSIPASFFLGIKVISWEHANCNYELSIPYRRMILKWFTSRSARVVTLTPGDAAAFQKLYGRRERIRTIMNPVEEKKWIDSVRRKNRIITVSRLVPEKGFDLLIKVAQRVLGRNPDWEWMICGEGPERERLEDFRKQEGLEARFLLTGQVSNVEEYLTSSRLFVLTSRAEGLPMCLLEARTYGLACISFDIPTGPADIIEEGENGYLIPPFDWELMADRIQELIQNTELLDHMGKQAERNMDRFLLPCIAKQWNELLDEVLNEKG